ncbi:GNAT family N-acetyltransferase [Mangrovihabitans endophyticus]|uniref:N-acetyltransferase domain-containing protein n=1 Tax=Mangrovihabitans endophyticus TaxID=1751298 RepID=A0A8J3FRC3_9ACTN|nr:GNAT family N-acetyltransferase [Mangrovihabitans endophyticus]GGL14696.1 hypothetical protein GCM10012284_56790 [Mangrovihabitans endophyticus]
MLIELRPGLDPELTALVVAQQRELGLAAGIPWGREHLVGIVDGRAVACGAWRSAGPEVAILARLYVRPAYRRRGLGRQLVVALEEEISAAGRSEVRLSAFIDRPAALALFRAAGYLPAPGGRLTKSLSVLGRVP